MGNSKIPWLKNPDGTQGKTWNVITGCTPCSPGCDNCWAQAYLSRFKKPLDIRVHRDKMNEPLKWRNASRVLISSMGDLFHEKVRDEWLWDIFNVVHRTPWHHYFILTKRPVRMASFLDDVKEKTGYDIWRLFPNISLGISAENQIAFDMRYPHLIKIEKAVPKFISFEPLIGPVDNLYNLQMIDMVIIGAESGPNRRICYPEWICNIFAIAKHREAPIPVFIKQIHDENKNLIKMPKWIGKIYDEFAAEMVPSTALLEIRKKKGEKIKTILDGLTGKTPKNHQLCIELGKTFNQDFILQVLPDLSASYVPKNREGAIPYIKGYLNQRATEREFSQAAYVDKTHIKHLGIRRMVKYV